jgi:hypothetical protein
MREQIEDIVARKLFELMPDRFGRRGLPHRSLNGEQLTDQIIDLIYGDIEKMENPYFIYSQIIDTSEGLRRDGFEECRQKILSLLRPRQPQS